MGSAAGVGTDWVESLVEDFRPESITCRTIWGYGKWALQFAPARHIAFGVVTEGRCQIADEWGQAISLCRGDFLVTAPPNGWMLTAEEQDCRKLQTIPQFVGPTLRQAGVIDGSPTECIAAGFASLLNEQEYLQGWIGHGFVIREEAARTVKSTLVCLEEEARATTGASSSIQRRLLQVLLLQAFQAESSCLGNIAHGQDSGAKGLFTALRAMQSQPAVEWTVATLAAVAYMSRSVFARRFEQMLGLSPMRYLRERRMLQAKTALLNGMPVKHVATQVGYRSDKAFSTAFHRRFQQTPDGFRRVAVSPEQQDA